MKIGVSGASGHLGKAVVSELLQRAGGHEVVAITRTPETVSGPAHVRFGDYDRPESLAEAYAGLDRLLIITTVAPEPGKRGAQNVAAIDAAVKAGLKHIAFMSAVGTRREEEPARGASYWRGEQHLIATAPAWTILRMNFYAEAFVQLAQAALGQGVLAGLTQAGLPAGAINIVTGIQASFAAGLFDIVTGDVERLGGRPPRPLRDVLAAALKSPSV